MKNRRYHKILIFCISCFLINISIHAQDIRDCEYENNKAVEKYEKAENLYKSKKYIDCEKIVREIVKTDPEYGAPYYLLGMLTMRKEGENDKTVQAYFEKLISLCPDFQVYPYFYLGGFYYDNGKYDSCITMAKKFLENPDKVKNDDDYKYASDMLEYAEFMSKLSKSKVPFNPVLVEGVSSPQKEYSFSISPDNLTMYYTRQVPKPQTLSAFGQIEELVDKVAYSNFDGSRFGKGELMDEPFDKGNIESFVSLTADNMTMYCTQCQQNAKKDYFNCDIVCLTKDEYGNWSEPENLGIKINNEYSREIQPSISADGKTLYFVSDREGGFGGSDIYVSNKLPSGEWSAAKNLGAGINTADNERTPFLHSDGKTLYFSSNGWKGAGETDIYYTRLDKKTKMPINIGMPINDENDQFGFMVSFDGATGYLASDYIKDKNQGDLYAFELYKEARPEKTLVIYGEVYELSGARLDAAQIELTNTQTQQVYKTKLDPKTERYILTAPAVADYTLKVYAEGYQTEEQTIDIQNSKYKLPAECKIYLKKKK